METLGERSNADDPPSGVPSAFLEVPELPEDRQVHEYEEMIRTGVRGLLSVDLGVFGPRRLLALLVKILLLQALVAALVSRVIGRADAIHAHKTDGLHSLAAWLKQYARMSGATASREVKRARALRQMPTVWHAFESGDLSTDQVDAYVRVFNSRTAAAFHDDEEMLVDRAAGLSADQLAASLRAWAEAADTDGPEPDPGHRDRGMSMSQSFDGRWNGTFTFGSGDGALIDAAIRDRADQLFRADQRDGASRSATQRRADALRDLILGDAAPSVTIDLLIDADALERGICSSRLMETGTNATVGGGHLSAADTLRLAADAAYRAVVVDPAGGAVLYYGRSRRLASLAQRDALKIETNGRCAVPGCGHNIDVDHHIVDWHSRSGPTDLPVLVGLCFSHHNDIHDGGWSIDKAPDGTITWTRPDGTLVSPAPRCNSSTDPPDDATDAVSNTAERLRVVQRRERDRRAILQNLRELARGA